MSGFLFSSHDGFGLGHVRRNATIASAVRAIDGRARIALVTGVGSRFGWLDRPDMEIVRVPPIVKDQHGRYAAQGMTLDEALARRTRAFSETVARLDPDVIVIDRHPFGIFDELREGLERARRTGSRIVLGMRDVLDEPAAIARELGGPRWAGASDVFDEAIVYGERHFCDHEAEYGLPISPRYCGWVVEPVWPGRRESRLLAITAGGGGDGESIFRLGIEVLRRQPEWTGVFAAGPFIDRELVAPGGGGPVDDRLAVIPLVDGCPSLLGRASGVLQMAGYNSTYEALAAGLLPILRPRTRPRQEQAIRATRLAALGLADVVAADADPASVARLLDRSRILPADALRRAGATLDGAARSASHLVDLASRRRRAPGRSVPAGNRATLLGPVMMARSAAVSRPSMAEG